jgi:hypothetical protein
VKHFFDKVIEVWLGSFIRIRNISNLRSYAPFSVYLTYRVRVSFATRSRNLLVVSWRNKFRLFFYQVLRVLQEARYSGTSLANNSAMLLVSACVNIHKL